VKKWWPYIVIGILIMLLIGTFGDNDDTDFAYKQINDSFQGK